MENKRQAAAAQVEPNQLAAMVEQLVATCDHYAARCTQESLLLEDRQEQLDQALEQKERQCARQKIQIDYLNARNLRYQRLYQRITGTWYGKILLKIYHFMQKIGWISK